MDTGVDQIIELAAHQIGAGIRLDTRMVASRFGIGRTTLFRRVGNREDLLGEALWLLAARTLQEAGARWDDRHGTATRDERPPRG